MRRIKSAVFDSVSIPDMSLVLTKDTIYEIPDDIFKSSQDLNKAITNGHVICEGIPHKGRYIRFSQETTYPAQSTLSKQGNPATVESRVSILESSVNQLLKKDYEIPTYKYEDYILYSSSFDSSEYDAMIFDMFLDETKRDPNDPGNAKIKHACVTTDNDQDFFFFNSKEFEITHPVKEIFPMIRWSGDGHLIVEIKMNNKKLVILNTQLQINTLWTPISVDPTQSLSINVGLCSKYNSIQMKSYGILAKF